MESGCDVLGSGMEVTQNLSDGKRGILSSASKASSKRNLGIRNSKSLKRQHLAASLKNTQLSASQTDKYGSKSARKEHHASAWVGDLVPRETGGGRSSEQAAKAISSAPLRQIRVDNPGKEVDSGSSEQLQCPNLLQGGHDRDSKVYDGLETKMEEFQGPTEEYGMEYGGISHNES
nr:hypothetical protein CFP56_07224 [Quercus suber]